MTEESKVMTMKDAISKFVKDGMTLYISAVWANHAAAAAHEIIRQGKKDLTLIESSPGEIFDHGQPMKLLERDIVFAEPLRRV
jgi:acyl CoA:acetate/3-ketoacid CoA transferase alpha subunit